MHNAVREKQLDDRGYVRPESTYLNPGIHTLKELKDWVLIKLGHPLLTVELTTEQLDSCVADAIAVYSKYCYTEEKYLMVNLRHYKPHVGLDLRDFNVVSVKDISFQRDNMFGMYGDMFFGPYAYFGQGASGLGSPMFGFGSGNPVGGWVTYHNVMEFFDLCKRMTGSNPDWSYDRRTKILVLMPEPRCLDRDQFALLTCNVEPPIEEFYGNEWVRRLVLAEAKILLGTVRKKFQNVQLVGGGSLDTSIGDEGREEKNQLMEEIIKQESKGQSWVIA